MTNFIIGNTMKMIVIKHGPNEAPQTTALRCLVYLLCVLGHHRVLVRGS